MTADGNQPKSGRASRPSGLFKATGNKPRDVVVRDMLTGEYRRVPSDQAPRPENDFYPTPAEPTRAFLAAEIDRLREFDVILEPACGDGSMVREIRAVGLECIASDLVDRGCAGARILSFYDPQLLSTLGINGKRIAKITNPPFAECSWRDGNVRWQRHALETLGLEYMALLLPWTFPGAGGLEAFWAKHRPARVYMMRWKIDFDGRGQPPTNHGWFVWDSAHRGETVLRMIDRDDDARQELLPLDEVAA